MVKLYYRKFGDKDATTQAWSAASLHAQGSIGSGELQTHRHAGARRPARAGVVDDFSAVPVLLSGTVNVAEFYP